jgi:hypothetical protein
VHPARSREEPAAVEAHIAQLCRALQNAGLAEEKARLTAGAVAGASALDARLERIQLCLDRIEARLGEVEHELAGLIRPSWPF